MLLGGDEIGPHPGRQQQRLVPGHRDLLVRLGRCCESNGELLAFTRKLIALRRAHAGLPPPPVPARRARSRAPGLPDAWWFRSDGRADDRRATGAARRRSSACSSTARRSPSPDARGRQVLDESFLLLFNAHHEDCAFTLPDGAFGDALDAGARHGASRSSSRARASCRPGAEVDAGPPLAGAAAPRRGMTRACARPTGCSSAGELRLRRGARARALPARPRRLAPLPAAVVPGARGLDARLRRRRPARRSRASSAARTSSARWSTRCARRAWGSCSTSSPTTWRPTTRTATGRDPELRAQFFDIDPVTGRHRRFFDVDHLAGVRQEDPEVFAATHALALRLVREGVVDGLRIDHPDGLADPAGYLRGCATAAPSTCGWRRSSTPASRCATGRSTGTVGYEFLNDVGGAVRRPGGRGAADRPVGRGLRRRPAASASWAFEAKLEQARDDVRARGRAAARDAPRARRPGSSARWPRCPSTAPTSSRGRARRRRATARRSPRPGCPRRWRACCCSRRPAGTRSSPASSRRRRR